MFAQTLPVFHHLTIENGLAQNTITSIAQDSRGFIWFGTPNGLSRFDSKEFKNYRHNPKNPGSLVSDYVISLLSDSKETLWVGTNDGLCKYNPDTDSFTRFVQIPNNQNSLTNNTIRSIYEDSRGRIWIGTDGGINCLVKKNGQVHIIRFLDNYQSANNKLIIARGFAEDKLKNIWAATNIGLVKISPDLNQQATRFFLPDSGSNNSVKNRISSIAIDKNAQLWLGTMNGHLYTFNPKETQFKPFYTSKSGDESFSIINKILASVKGKLWIGTNEGLFSIDPDTKQIEGFYHDAINNKTINDNIIFSILEDKQHTLWLGTYYGGASYVYANKTAFHSIPTNIGKRNIVINKILEDKQGSLWFTSPLDGLLTFDKSTHSIIPYVSSIPKTTRIQQAYFDSDGILWMGSSENKVMSYDIRTNKYNEYTLFQSQWLNGKQYSTTSIVGDSNGTLWFANSRIGLFNFDKKTKKVIRYSTDNESPVGLSSNEVFCLLKDSQRNLWIGTKQGVNLIRPDKSTQWFPTLVKNHASSYKGSVNVIHEDKKGRIWIGTFYSGLLFYDANNNILIKAKGMEPYADININNIQSDKAGYLWLSHEGGLLRYHPDKVTIQKYDFSEGLPGQEILLNSSMEDSAGEIFFSTNDGLFGFYPDRVPINTQIPEVVFTGLKLFNKPVAVKDSTGLLNKDISKINKVIFNHEQSIFTIDFAVLNFIKPEKNQYAYMLEGFEKNWNYIKNPSATYTNLPVGTYTLLIKGANNDGLWNQTPTRLSITVLPPWWKTDFAYLMYCLVTGLALFLGIRFFWIRETFKKETELYEAKLDFFTNISHEIRTHLTLISGPINNLLRLRQQDAELHNMLNFTKRNTDLLINLVNELLDFSKIQHGLLKLNVSENNLHTFLKQIASSVDYLFIEKGINFNFSNPNDALRLWFDPLQLQKVIYNILINAYKFTPKGGTVSLTVTETASQIQIKIIDNGIGILPEYLKKIFSNFFQVFDNISQNTGYGVGLALSKSIIELHKGELLVDSQIGHIQNNTCFTICLLKGNNHFGSYLVSETNIIEEPEYTETLKPELHEPKTVKILLVEDNEELRAFIKEVLEKDYEVIEAENGKVAWEIASNDIPDLVISDIMMAEMNGLELCRKIKTDGRTNHIPVIILTARSGISNEIEGLGAGADAYLSKPFNIDVLLLSVKNLIESHKLLQQKYYQSIMAETDIIEVNQTNDKFLANIVEAVETQIAEQQFSVHALSHMIGMSLTVLYKKLKAVTGLTVNEFVKSVQMNKAARLLRTTDLNINEISFKVGFEDRKYFSKEFKKRFGKTPSEYAADNRLKV